MNNDLLKWRLEDVSAELCMLETHTGVAENFTRDTTYSNEKDITNGILSLLWAQNAKIQYIIGLVNDIIDKASKKCGDADWDVLRKVDNGELPESILLDQETKERLEQ